MSEVTYYNQKPLPAYPKQKLLENKIFEGWLGMIDTQWPKNFKFRAANFAREVAKFVEQGQMTEEKAISECLAWGQKEAHRFFYSLD